IRDFIISTREVATAKAAKSAKYGFIAWNQVAAAITSHSCTKETNVSNTGSASSVSSLPYAKSTTKYLLFSDDVSVRKQITLLRDLLLTELAEFEDLSIIFYATLSRTAVMSRIPAVVITVPYRRGDSSSWIRLIYGTV